MSGKKRQQAERPLTEAGRPEPLTQVADVGMTRMVHELQIHQVELETQNEELREAQTNLEISAAHLTELYDCAPVGYFSLTADGIIRQLNLMGAGMLGWERELLSGCRFADFVSAGGRRTFEKFLAGIFAGRSATSCEVTLMRGEQAAVIARLTGTLAAGDLSCRVAAMDLTEQRRLEAAVHEKHEDLDRIFNLSADLLALARTDGQFIRLNPAFEKVLGYDLKTLMNTPFIEFVHEDDREATWQALAELRAGRNLLDFVNRYRCRDGSYRCLEWRSTPARGEIICALARDITDRCRTEDALRDSEEALKQAHAELESKVRLRTEQLQQRTTQLRALASELTLAEERERRRIAHLMHDGLQQSLVAALQNLAEYRSHAAQADDAAGLKAVENLLRESIQSTRTLTAELSPAVLHQCGLAAALNWLRPWAMDKFGLTLEVTVEEDIDPGLDDSVTLFLCVRELLFNIVKHSGVDAAELRMWRTRPGGELRIEVSDEGAGFDPAVVRAREGLTGGFGLFNVRERLEMLGGGLGINSQPACGSRFTLWLPTRPAVAEPVADSPGETTAGPAMDQGLVPAAAAAAGPTRLLVVDDNSGVRNTFVRLLQAQADFEVVGQAADGLEAVELVRQLRPQLVLMDVEMPRMNGLEATAAINREFPDVNVLGISATTEVELRVSMIRAGALDLLSKDHSPDFLVAILRCHAGQEA